MSRSFDYRPSSVQVLFGEGRAAEAVADALDAIRSSKALVVLSPSQRSRAADVLDRIEPLTAAVFDGVEEHVPAPVAEAARRLAESMSADAIVSIGGGSATGTAKAIALTTGLPIVAVPTTFAGSEVTPVWGITTDGIKRTGTDARVLPKVVVYDPLLLRSLPHRLSINSAFNALAHCVEAFWAQGANPVTSLIAAEGVRVLAQGVRALAIDQAASPAVEDLLYGSFLAGTAFASAGSGLHHKVCHVLGGAFNLPHAATHAVVLPHVLALNAPHIPDAAAALASAFGTSDATAGLVELAVLAGAPRTLSELGINATQVLEAIDLVVRALPIANPLPVTPAVVEDLIWAAYGRPARTRTFGQRRPSEHTGETAP